MVILLTIIVIIIFTNHVQVAHFQPDQSSIRGFEGKLHNPCPSVEKDAILGIDRSRDAADRILLIGYVTGAAYPANHTVPATDYNRAGSMISGALTYAVHLVNTLRERFNASERQRRNLPEPPLPPGYKLDFCYLETFGTESASIRAVTGLVERVRISAILGPQETCRVEAAIAATYNLPMISHYCDDHSLRGKLFGRPRPVFLRTRPQPYDIASAVLALLKQFKWYKVAYLTTEDPELGFTAEVLRNTLVSQHIKILYTATFRFPQLCGLSTNQFKDIVEQSYRNVRIYLVVGEVYDSVCLLEALRTWNLLKSGDYFVVGIDKRTYDPSALHMWSQSSWPSDLARKLHAGELPRESCLHMNPECYRAYMQVTHTAPSSERCAQLQEYNQCYLTKPPFNFKLSSSNFNLELEAGYLVDALWLYALAAGEILAAGGTIDDVANGDLIASKLINRRYESSLGYVNEINERGDAQGNYTVIMAVSDSNLVSSAPSECGAVTAYQRSPDWYDQNTPMLPAQCRRTRADRMAYPTESQDALMNDTRNAEDLKELLTAMTSFDVPFTFQPIGIFYPSSPKDKRNCTDGQCFEQSEENQRSTLAVDDDDYDDDQTHFSRLGPAHSSMSQQASYNFPASLPLMSELGKRTKRYSFIVSHGHQIPWINGHTPLDEPVCGFDGSRCKTRPSKMFEVCLSILAAVILVVAIGGVFVYRNQKFEMELERLLWKVDSKDIVLRTPTIQTNFSESAEVSPSNNWTFARLFEPGAESNRKRFRRNGLLPHKLTAAGIVPDIKLTKGDENDLETTTTTTPLVSNPYRLFPTATKRREQRRQLIQSMHGSNSSGGIFSATEKKNLPIPKHSIVSSSETNPDDLNPLTTMLSEDYLRKQTRRQRLSSWFAWDSLVHRRTSEASSFFANLTPNVSEKPSETVAPNFSTCISSRHSPWFGPATVSGYFKRQLVAVHRIHLRYAHINRDVKKSLKLLRDVAHNNLASFIGACVELDRVCVLWEYASRGSLQDILRPEKPRLKPMFVASLTFDIIRGLTYLHESHLRYHGNLKSSNCVVDSRWVLKLTDFGLNAFRSGEGFGHLSSDDYFSRLYWTPPELLRRMLALVLSRQLSPLAHPQLVVLAETLMRQGVSFSLNDGPVEAELIAEEEHEGIHGTSITTEESSTLNEVNFGKAKTFNTERKKSLVTHPGPKFSTASINSTTIPNRPSLKAKLDLTRTRSVPYTVDPMETVKPKGNRADLPKQQQEQQQLSLESRWTTSVTVKNPMMVPCAAAAEAPKLSTILIHPGGASFMNVSQLDTARVPVGTHARVLRWSETSEPRFSRLFRSSKKVLYGGLFTASHSAKQKSYKRSSLRSHISLWLRRTIADARRYPGEPKPASSVQPESPPIVLLTEHERTPAHVPVVTRKRCRDCFLRERESDRLGRKYSACTAIMNTATTGTSSASHSRQRIRLPEVRDPIGSMQMADIYAFGIVLFELHLQNEPYKESRHKPQEIIRRVIVLNDQFGVPYRPKLSLLSREEKYITDCIDACWTEDPLNRPSIKQIALRLRPMVSDQHTNIMDHMMALMEDYAQELEKLVAARTTELQQEKRLSEALLYQMLPVPVAEQLKRGKLVEPEAFDNVTIYFSDICGFTEWSSTASPFEVVNLLNELYTRFDAVLSSYDVYKVETIGDAYMVVSGLPQQNDNHAGEIASMSLRLLEEIQHNFTLALRIGIHSGPCAAGVVGTRMPRYCLFGDTVNTASRMEGSGAPWRIHCSEQCKRELDRFGLYVLEERGPVSLKGKGIVQTYWLLYKTWSSRNQSLPQTMDYLEQLQSSEDLQFCKQAEPFPTTVLSGQPNDDFHVLDESPSLVQSMSTITDAIKVDLMPLHLNSDEPTFYPPAFTTLDETCDTANAICDWSLPKPKPVSDTTSGFQVCGHVVLERQKRTGYTSVLPPQTPELGRKIESLRPHCGTEHQHQQSSSGSLSLERLHTSEELEGERYFSDTWNVTCGDLCARKMSSFPMSRSGSSDGLRTVWQWNPTPSNPGTP